MKSSKVSCLSCTNFTDVVMTKNTMGTKLPEKLSKKMQIVGKSELKIVY